MRRASVVVVAALLGCEDEKARCGANTVPEGDACVCVGPPDVIAMGSMKVLIGGQPAARLGDMTAHGGAITVGFPQVLIG